jgi:hypothetical protein
MIFSLGPRPTFNRPTGLNSDEKGNTKISGS